MFTCELDLYAPAFAVLRSALEQILFDRLMFAASGYRRRMLQVSKAEGDKLHAEFTEGADWARNVSGVDWVSGTLTVTYSGIHPADPSQIPPLSPYFWHVDEYDPFHGRPDGTYSEIVWLGAGWTAPTWANANRTTGLPNSYPG